MGGLTANLTYYYAGKEKQTFIFQINLKYFLLYHTFL